MSTPYVPDYQPVTQTDPVEQIEPVTQVQSTPLPVQQSPEEYVPEQISYEQPVEEIVYYEEDAFPAVPMDYLLILIAGLLVCIAVLICLKLATPKSSDDDDFDDYDE